MNQKQQHILVAPLNWGLGHATRCIPIIRELLKQNCRVSITSDGSALSVLKSEFPSLSFFEMPGYRARYSTRVPFMLAIFWQMPKFIKSIWREHRQIETLVDEHDVDGIISDCRYGCWSSRIKTVFVTHQLAIKMPAYLRAAEAVINFFNRKQISKFDECWIPDDLESRLSGSLSNPMGLNHRFIGTLSRFSRMSSNEATNGSILVICSGPEPQRSAFEELCFNQLHTLEKNVIMVRGLPNHHSVKEDIQNIIWISHADAAAMEVLLAKADVVICRAGYSTLMDCLRLKKQKMIFIPTPGQTEQEYLAETLSRKKLAVFQLQENANLPEALARVQPLNGFASWPEHPNLLTKTIEEWISR